MKRFSVIIVLALVLILALSSAVSAAPANKDSISSFKDVAEHWAKDAIEEMVEKGIIDASKGGNFAPGKSITRAEFVVYLHKAAGIDIKYFKAPDIKEFFTDVSNEEPYAAALYDLATLNIIDYRGEFKPESTLPRDEMVHYVMNAYRYLDGEMPEKTGCKFTDKKKVDSKWMADVEAACQLGLIKGKTKNMFYPRDNATRGEAATVLSRMLKLLENQKDIKDQEKVKVEAGYEVTDGKFVMKLKVTNNKDAEVVIQHNSGQKFDFKLFDAKGESLYTWSADKLFIMALTETVIAPGETIEFSDSLDIAGNEEMLEKAVVLKGYITGESKDFKVNPDGYEVKISF